MKLSTVLAAAFFASSAFIPTLQAQDQVNLTWQMWGDENDSALWQSLADLVTEEYLKMIEKNS